MKSLTFQDPSAPDGLARAGTPRRLWPLAITSALLLVSLAVAFACLLTARKRTLDALVIVTLPSGADVVFDGNSLGPAPVKLEDVRLGAHTIRVAKDGFVPVEQRVDLDADSDAPIEFDLKPVTPPGSLARTPAEQIEEFTGLAEDAFARGDLAIPAGRSALYYADAILSLDRANAYARQLRERIRTGLLAGARAAVRDKDLARAKAAYEQLLDVFPGDADGVSGLAAVEDQLRRERTRLQDVLERGEAALRADRLIDPAGASAYAYAAKALAVDPANPQAAALRRRVRDRAAKKAAGLVDAGRVEEAAALLGRLVGLFPEDRPLRTDLDRLMAGAALDALRAHRDAGLAAFHAGNYRAAVDHLTAAVRLGAADSATRTALGLSYLKLGDAAQARRELERSVVQDASQADALVALGELAARSGDTRGALSYLRRARRLGGSSEYGPERLDAMIADIARRLAVPEER